MRRGRATTRVLAAIVVGAVALAAPPAHAAPSPGCCFTGSIWTCDDDTAIDAICDYDPFCCTTAWDLYCAYEYELHHDWTCPPLFTGVHRPDGSVEITAFADDLCPGDDPEDRQWVNQVHSDSLTPGIKPDAWLSEEEYRHANGEWGAGYGGNPALLEILSNGGGVVRGMLHGYEWFSHDGVCADPVDGVRFELRPETTKSCYAASLDPGCRDPSTEACVCYYDHYCCDTAWDSLCVNEVSEHCEWPI